MKRERIEDLGVINAKLSALLESFDNDWPYFKSKHSYETFEEVVTRGKCERLYELHTRLRFFRDELWEILAISRGKDGCDDD